MKKIPLQKLPSQKVRVVLDGQNVTLSLYYRFGNMYMDIITNDGLVQQGAVCRNRMNVVQVANTIFNGGLYFLDLLGAHDPYYKQFGSRYILLYVGDGEPLPGGLMT
jgi:hypothetical protein